jgi:peptidoglycan/LPS O-acetylase OafA/YrhL
VRSRFKRIFLVICLFLFLYVVVGGGLHLNPSGAFLAASTGTPLLIHVFNDWNRRSRVQDSHAVLEALDSGHRK